MHDPNIRVRKMSNYCLDIIKVHFLNKIIHYLLKFIVGISIYINIFCLVFNADESIKIINIRLRKFFTNNILKYNNGKPILLNVFYF